MSDHQHVSTCPRCEGSGRYQRFLLPAGHCALCNGTGKIGPNGDGAKSGEWIDGFETAEELFYEIEDAVAEGRDTIPTYFNPFKIGTDRHDGFEEGVYTFTQK